MENDDTEMGNDGGFMQNIGLTYEERWITYGKGWGLPFSYVPVTAYQQQLVQFKDCFVPRNDGDRMTIVSITIRNTLQQKIHE